MNRKTFDKTASSETSEVDRSDKIEDNDTDVSCSFCGTYMSNYVPKYFLGELVNPACANCDGSRNYVFSEKSGNSELCKSAMTRRGFNFRPMRPNYSKHLHLSDGGKCSHQKCCIIRQPFPPPTPAIVPLENDSSNYHIKVLKGSLGWGSTCGYCFRIDHKNYGCESCVWIKWYGQLHGYPDMNPYSYEKYLPDKSAGSGSQATDSNLYN